VSGYARTMTERTPAEPEPREVDADELAYEEVEADPDVPPGPVPEDDREVPDDEEPDLGDFEGNLNA
jgi:hypothetical protein